MGYSYDAEKMRYTLEDGSIVTMAEFDRYVRTWDRRASELSVEETALFLSFLQESKKRK